jgi:predicted ribosomally synthesized peptide with nif11-like leader
MSIESAQAFMNKVAQTEALHAPFIDAWTLGSMRTVVKMGKSHGYEFTDADVIAVRDMPKGDASLALKAFGAKLSSALDNPLSANELTDNQLEVVAGGGSVGGPIDLKYD